MTDDHSVALALLPRIGDLPGSSWQELPAPIHDGDGTAGPGELLDCVGPDFPPADAVRAHASSGYFVRPPAGLVHGLSVVFDDPARCRAAADVLSAPAFAACLARSVAADIAADDRGTEVLAADVTATTDGHRVSFHGATAAGVRAVHLDVTTLVLGRGATVLWFAGSPEPTPDHLRRAVAEAIRRRDR